MEEASEPPAEPPAEAPTEAPTEAPAEAPAEAAEAAEAPAEASAAGEGTEGQEPQEAEAVIFSCVKGVGTGGLWSCRLLSLYGGHVFSPPCGAWRPAVS